MVDIMTLVHKLRKYRPTIHPKDKNALVLYDISDKDMRAICKKYDLAGFRNEERNIAVVCVNWRPVPKSDDSSRRLSYCY